jgi:UDP-3-O-[3-hydroxymyristoyl] N-acetylglucosamine deacetylase
MQKTLKKQVVITGIALHSGHNVKLTINPSNLNSGIVFMRSDKKGAKPIKANYKNIVRTVRSTNLGLKGEDYTVETVEHLMAAFAMLNIDNAYVEVDHRELPAMDGSAKPYIEAILKAGILEQGGVRKALKILKPVKAADDRGVAEIKPSSSIQFKINAEIDYENYPIIGHEKYSCFMKYDNVTSTKIAKDVSAARTFGHVDELRFLQEQGLALGGSLDNAIGISDTEVLNPEGLRYEDEFVRHKILDAIGDMYLIGMPIIGDMTKYKGGHRYHAELMKQIMSDPSNYEVVDLEALRAQEKADGVYIAVSKERQRKIAAASVS